MIYFIDDNRGAVKIGFSESPQARFRGIESSYATDLKLLGTIEGNTKDEGDLHFRFGHIRLRGEWFLKTRELVEFIASLVPDLDVETIMSDSIESAYSSLLHEIKEKYLMSLQVPSEAREEAKAIILQAREEAAYIVGAAHREVDETLSQQSIMLERMRIVDEKAREKLDRAEEVLRRAEANAQRIVEEALELAGRVSRNSAIKHDRVLSGAPVSTPWGEIARKAYEMGMGI